MKMRIKKLLTVALAASVMSCGLISPSAAVVTEDDYTEAELDSSSYDLRKYTVPFWEGNIVYNEIVYPIRASDGTLSPFELMYAADRIGLFRLKTTDSTSPIRRERITSLRTESL